MGFILHHQGICYAFYYSLLHLLHRQSHRDKKKLKESVQKGGLEFEVFGIIPFT